MGCSAKDGVPSAQACAKLSELADRMKAGAEKIITRNCESDGALINAARPDHDHQLTYGRVHLLLVDDRP
jgi:hypothetical protein